MQLLKLYHEYWLSFFFFNILIWYVLYDFIYYQITIVYSYLFWHMYYKRNLNKQVFIFRNQIPNYFRFRKKSATNKKTLSGSSVYTWCCSEILIGTDITASAESEESWVWKVYVFHSLIYNHELQSINYYEILWRPHWVM